MVDLETTSPMRRLQVFAVDVSRPIPDSQVLKVEPALPGLELSARINAVLGRLRDSRGNYPTCFVVRQGALLLPVGSRPCSAKLLRLLRSRLCCLQRQSVQQHDVVRPILGRLQ